MFAAGCQLDWDELPRPDLPLTVGKSMPTDGPAKCFGFVQTYDTKPKRRLFEDSSIHLSAECARGAWSAWSNIGPQRTVRYLV